MTRGFAELLIAGALLGAVGCNEYEGVTDLGANQPPQVTITTPADGDTVAAGVTLTAEGSAEDPEEGRLVGERLTWLADGDSAIANGGDCLYTPTPGEHTLTLRAADAAGLSAEAVVHLIALEGAAETPPHCTILAPAEGAAFELGSVIQFRGSATDAECDTLSGLDLTWSSSLDGPFGHERVFSSDGLSAGLHTISLIAEDCTGLSDTASIALTIEEPADPITPAMVWIEPGSFTMGSPWGEWSRESDEEEHSVTLTEGFYICSTEVTEAQWINVMGSSPSFYRGCDDCPVQWLSWFEATEFCNAKSLFDGLEPVYDVQGTEVSRIEGANGYRLPTEAEWEYAYRAGSSSAFYNGPISHTLCDDPLLSEIAWYCQGGEFPVHAVGLKEPNAWGLYDMSGNVREWCWDWYGDYPRDPVTDPQGSESGVVRVFRGGGWDDHAAGCRAAERNSAFPVHRYTNLGLRLVSGAVTTGIGAPRAAGGQRGR
jgi:formylglycine-generating enzyme required for sulfatase activity